MGSEISGHKSLSLFSVVFTDERKKKKKDVCRIQRRIARDV
jgi:hypothetical protein